jgi:hypothetical protein
VAKKKRRLRRLLLRPSLSADLDAKFLTIFTQYGAEVQRIEEQYTRECNRPPLARNAPFVTGAISWARQLLDRIYGPMQVFTQHPHVFVPKENKRIVKQFNKLAKVLMQFELIHYQEWCRSVEKVKAAGGRARVEGADTGEWVLVDLGDIVVHIMVPPVRAYYALEEIWGTSQPKPRKTAARKTPAGKTASRTAK